MNEISDKGRMLVHAHYTEAESELRKYLSELERDRDRLEAIKSVCDGVGVTSDKRFFQVLSMISGANGEL